MRRASSWKIEVWVWLARASAGATRVAARASRTAARRSGSRLVIRSREPNPVPEVAPEGAAGAAGHPLRTAGSAAAGGAQALLHLGPVHDVPPGVDVVRALVLVLQVVGVLPDVDAEQRRLPVGDRVVLVGR